MLSAGSFLPKWPVYFVRCCAVSWSWMGWKCVCLMKQQKESSVKTVQSGLELSDITYIGVVETRDLVHWHSRDQRLSPLGQ